MTAIQTHPLKILSILMLTGVCVGAVWIERVQMETARLRRQPGFDIEYSPKIAQIIRLKKDNNYAAAIARCREYVALLKNKKVLVGQEKEDLLFLAYYCRRLGLARESLELNQCMELSSHPGIKAMQLLEIASCRVVLGDYRTAQAELLEALRILPKGDWQASSIKLELSKTYMIEGNRDEALRTAANLQDLSDSNLYLELAKLDVGESSKAKTITQKFMNSWRCGELMDLLFVSRYMRAKGYPECAKLFDAEVLQLQSMTWAIQVERCPAQK